MGCRQWLIARVENDKGKNLNDGFFVVDNQHTWHFNLGGIASAQCS